MGLFDKPYSEITAFLDRNRKAGRVSEFIHTGKTTWPEEKNRNLVMGPDTAVELGNPKDAATSFLLWVDDSKKIINRRISVVGPDLPALTGKQASFGKVVMVGGKGFDADNAYERSREMELLRYDVHLKGYMMRGASQYQREWSRVSREAISSGFSFQTLGGALMEQFLALDYVEAAEIIFITSTREDVLEMKTIGDNVARRVAAMNKMAEEMTFDCDTCDYNAVCGDVAELRAMRERVGRAALKKKETAVHA
jgi:CO dehydrogenase/acetyl-CoA synthase beta subunit